MHSVSDWLVFAIWEEGTLVRSLSLAPDGGIIGFILEGRRLPTDVDPYAEHLRLHGFRAIDPSGTEQARRDAIREAVRNMPPLRTFRYIDGRMVEVDLRTLKPKDANADGPAAPPATP